jgi:hypothetical protein
MTVVNQWLMLYIIGKQAALSKIRHENIFKSLILCSKYQAKFLQSIC